MNLYELIKRKGAICRDPDWPKTFVLSDVAYDEEFLPAIPIEWWRVNSFNKNGYKGVRLDEGYMLRRNSIIVTAPTWLDLYKELDEKDSAKPTDL